MPSLPLPCPLDCPSTLLGGQSFCWNEVSPGTFSGWIAHQPVRLTSTAKTLHWDNPNLSPAQLRHYFTLDLAWPSLLATFPASDLSLATAQKTYPGLRALREDPWECLANFICSSLKQIVQIRQINSRLRQTFGGPHHLFPSASLLAHAGETALRSCGLGYRARHLFATAQIIASQPTLLDIPSSLSTPQAAAHLEQLPGVGPKISRCVLLYAYSRWDAFPIDVWVDRLLRELYFPRKRKPFRLSDLEKWSAQHFGPHRGLAQLLLFHWYRTRPKLAPSKKRPPHRSPKQK